MARTAIDAQEVVATGLEAIYEAANAEGNMFDNDGDRILHVKNGSAGSVDVTIQSAAEVDGLAVSDQVVSIPAGEDRFIGRFKPSTYNRPSGAADAGKVYVDYSASDSVTVVLLKV